MTFPLPVVGGSTNTWGTTLNNYLLNNAQTVVVAQMSTGASDNGPALVAAVNAAITSGGGLVSVPAGTFMIGSTAQGNLSNLPTPAHVWVVGAGDGQTILKAQPTITALNLGGGQGTWAVPLCLQTCGGVTDITFDGGAMNAIGTLSSGLTSGLSNPVSSLSVTGLSASTCPALAQMTGTAATAGNTFTTNASNNAPGVVNGMVVATSSNTGVVALGTTVTSGAGSNVLTLSAVAGNGSVTLTFTNGAGSSCGAVLCGGRIQVVDPTVEFAQTFDLQGPQSGTITTLQVGYDWPTYSFPTGSTVYAPVAQGANQAFMFMFSAQASARGDSFTIQRCTFKNISQAQYTASSQQYTFYCQGQYSVDRLIIEDVINGPNSNPNQDSCSVNGIPKVTVRNVIDTGIYRSANFYTYFDLKVHGMKLENPVAGANTSGGTANRMLCFGEAQSSDSMTQVHDLGYSDRNQLGGNIYVGSRSIIGTGWDIPGMDCIIASVTSNVATGGGAGGNFTLITLATAPTVVPVSYLASVGANVRFTLVDNQSSGAGSWQNMCNNNSLTVQTAVSTTSFTVNFNSTAMTGANVNALVNEQVGSLGVGLVSLARFSLGTCSVNLNNNQHMALNDADLSGSFRSGINILNGTNGVGPGFVRIAGRLGAFYNGSASLGCVVAAPTNSMGPIELNGVFDANGGPLVTAAGGMATVDLLAFGTARNATGLLSASNVNTNPGCRVAGITNAFQTLTTPPISTTGYQNTTGMTLDISCNFTTTSAAGTVTLAISATNSGYTTIATETPATTAVVTNVGAVVPSGWWYKYTFTNATAGALVAIGA